MPEATIQLLIEHQCPQCGAPATLTETERLFTCQYCRVKSYLVTRDYFRYMLPGKAPKNEKLLLFPYWRFKGILFSLAANQIRHRFIDVSHQALESRHIPVSVGLRSQALKLQFVSPETAGHFLKPTQSLADVMQTFKQRFNRSLPQPIIDQAHIGDTLSLLYSPFYVDGKLYDAVLNKAVSPQLPDDLDMEQWPGGAPDWHIDFLPTLCPHCGWDLEGQRETLVLLCKNCNSTWYAVGKRLKKLKFGRHPADDTGGIYLPFWRIRAGLSGIALNSYADLVKVANLPRVIQKGWEDIGFRFWVPAFKVRPRLFLRLANHMTLSQPHEKLIPDLPPVRHHPVTLPVKEAVESLKIILAGFMKPVKHVCDRLPEIEIRAQSFVLVYIYFREKQFEYIQPQLQLAINKNVLALSNNL